MKRDPNFDFYSFNFNQPDEQSTPKESEPPKTASRPQRPNLPPLHRELPNPDATRAMRRSYSRIGWAFVVMVVAWYAVATAAEAVLLVLAPHLLEVGWLTALIGTLPLYLVGIPLLLLTMLGLPRYTPSREPFGTRAFLVALAAAIAAMTVGNVIGTTVMTNLSLLSGYSFSNLLEQTFELPLWCSVLLTAVCAPVFEELIFRKLLLDRLLPFGEWMAVFVSALLFGAMHGNFYQFFYALLIGLVLGYVYVRSGKWQLCVLLHLIINVVGGIVPTLILELLDYDTLLALIEQLTNAAPEAMESVMQSLVTFAQDNVLGIALLALYELLYYGATVTGIILLIVHRRRIRFEPRENQLPRGFRTAPALLNTGIIAALGLCALLFLVTLVVTAVPM